MDVITYPCKWWAGANETPLTTHETWSRVYTSIFDLQPTDVRETNMYVGMEMIHDHCHVCWWPKGTTGPLYWPRPVFCLLLGVSSDYAQPITDQVTEVTCPVIGRAQPELTLSKRQETGPGEATWPLSHMLTWRDHPLPATYFDLVRPRDHCHKCLPGETMWPLPRNLTWWGLLLTWKGHVTTGKCVLVRSNISQS